jgi:hypothetical protein
MRCTGPERGHAGDVRVRRGRVRYRLEARGRHGRRGSFTLEAEGKVVFAIEAGVVLTSDVDAKITLKPIQTPGRERPGRHHHRGGTYTIHNSFEPINWTRGAKRKGEKAAAADTTDQPAKAEEKPASRKRAGRRRIP